MNSNIEIKPLVFTEARRKKLELYLSGFTYLNRLKWNSNKSFVTFRICVEPFKIVTAPNRSADMTKIIYYSDRPRCGWVINAHSFHLSCPSVIKAIKTICYLMDKYESVEIYQKMKDIAIRDNLDPMVLKHKCFEVNGQLVLDVPDTETEKLNMLIKELIDKAINELNITSDRYDATFYIIKRIAYSVFADTLSGLKQPQEGTFSYWFQLKNEYPVEY